MPHLFEPENQVFSLLLFQVDLQNGYVQRNDSKLQNNE